MKYQQLGHTGIFVSRLCLGTMTFGGATTEYQMIGGLTQQDANVLVKQALDAGVNFFDTANIYAWGESEIQLGKALGTYRHKVILATKVHGRMGDGPNEVGLSRTHIIHEIEASLKRLNTDYIDLYQIHGFDPLTPLEETLTTLDNLVKVGKIRYIGCSNLAAWQMMKALGMSAQLSLEKFVTLQSYYSLVGRDIEREIVPFLNDQKIGLLVWSPLAGGFLSGKFTRATSAMTSESRRSQFNFPPINTDKAYSIIDTLQMIAVRRQSTVAQVALSWLLHQPHVTSVIIGAKKANQLQDNLAAINLQLDSDDIRELDKISCLLPEYPAWMHHLPSERNPGEIRDWSKAVTQTIKSSSIA